MDWTAAITILLTILGATWRIENRIGKRIDALDKKIDAVEAKLEAKIDALSQKVDSIEKRLIRLESYGEAKEFQEWKLERKK